MNRIERNTFVRLGVLLSFYVRWYIGSPQHIFDVVCTHTHTHTPNNKFKLAHHN